MKFLAINLPAFHQIPENDKWWGEGFTEWDNVRAGKALFEGHYQPIEPKNQYYYDLSQKEDIERQIKLAKEYDIYGFVYYHYWFGNGKMLFEKPLQILREEIKEQFHYCLCWANDTWITTWHGLQPKTLIEQKYPGKDDWEKHYDYFQPFFQDNRYIKIDEKPVLFIYQPNEIVQYDDMVSYWENRAVADGFKGIYIVEYISSKNRKLASMKSSAVTEFEPLYTAYFDITKFNLLKRFLCKKLKCVDFQDYNVLWNNIINRKRTYQGKPIIRGCFVGWDNSARKGKQSMIVKNSTPDKFGKNMEKLINNNRKDVLNDFILINAWNEWSEGAILEPTEKYADEYLNEIKRLASKY